jgi:glyoxylase-like metal-dependent hydrolase (beta-lactamase superfamily II)
MHIERIVIRETNCYLLRGESGTIVIDPGPPGGAAAVAAGLARAGVKPVDVRLILVTHGHIDHFGSAAGVKALCGAPVAAQRDVPALSRERRNALPPAQSLRGSLIRWAFLLLSPVARYLPLEADVLLDEGDDLTTYGTDCRVLLVPGHAPGSLALLTPEHDAFVGDLFVNYTVPSQPLYMPDRRAWQQSYARVHDLSPRMVYVGHGEPFAGDKLERIYPARYQFRWWVW